jgi:hypothetical protein
VEEFMQKRLILSLAAPVLLVPLVGCEHHRHVVEREEVVRYEVDTTPPPPPREEVVIRERPYPGAVWVRGFWERDRARHVWVWRPGHWH